MFKKGEVKLQSKTFISVQEVAEELGVSKSYAYRVVKQLNEELKQQGYLTVLLLFVFRLSFPTHFCPLPCVHSLFSK
ncbi:helix-turn-helix domain-containing protein [Eubacterium ventriosum]|uniref:helix-turn-helix domain-containing protein n=1 Tax=Eubacterium ventriosum TaxID=39496 RepID=UPI003AB3CC30